LLLITYFVDFCAREESLRRTVTVAGGRQNSSSVEVSTSASHDQATLATDYIMTPFLASSIVLGSLVLLLVIGGMIGLCLFIMYRIRRSISEKPSTKSQLELVDSHKKIHGKTECDYVAMNITPNYSNDDSLEYVTVVNHDVNRLKCCSNSGETNWSKLTQAGTPQQVIQEQQCYCKKVNNCSLSNRPTFSSNNTMLSSGSFDNRPDS